jgi:YHS domain-containing protein
MPSGAARKVNYGSRAFACERTDGKEPTMNIETFKSLLWWVAIPLLLFWMMRRGGGCGMMGLGRAPSGSADAEGQRSRSASGRPVDPVCGMEVDPAQAVATRTAGGSTFFLCSAMCLEAFDKDPGLYANRGHGDAPHRHQHAGC